MQILSLSVNCKRYMEPEDELQIFNPILFLLL